MNDRRKSKRDIHDVSAIKVLFQGLNCVRENCAIGSEKSLNKFASR